VRYQNFEKWLSVSSCLWVCPSVIMEQFGSQLMDFHEIWYLSIFRKSDEKIQVSVKSDKNNGYFTWRLTYIYDSKGEAVPLQAYTYSGPEGSKKLRFPNFMTTAQYGGKVVSLTHRPPLPPENTPGTHFC